MSFLILIWALGIIGIGLCVIQVVSSYKPFIKSKLKSSEVAKTYYERPQIVKGIVGVLCAILYIPYQIGLADVSLYSYSGLDVPLMQEYAEIHEKSVEPPKDSYVDEKIVGLSEPDELEASIKYSSVEPPNATPTQPLNHVSNEVMLLPTNAIRIDDESDEPNEEDETGE